MLALLALVAGQDAGPAEGSDGRDGRWRIARKVTEDRVISVTDPDARHTRKSQQARRDGYRAHVAAHPETGIITDEQLTRASGQENSDPAAALNNITSSSGLLVETRTITTTTDFLSFSFAMIDNVCQRRIMHISPALEFRVSGEPCHRHFNGENSHR